VKASSQLQITFIGSSRKNINLMVKYFIVIGLELLMLSACAKPKPTQTIQPVKKAPEFVEFYSPF
jgi:uncharacterized lipoprotein YajG